MMLREIDRKFYGEGTAAIPAESGIRRKFGKKAVSSVTVISGSDGKNDGGRGPRSDISSESYLQTVIRRFKRHHLAAVSLIVLAVIVGAAILAPVIAPYDPNDIAGPFAEGPSKEFWLGTDQIGRDVLSRLLYATRISLLVGVMATLISTGIGVLFGLVAGYFGGVADMIIMRFTDMVMSFPYILLVLVAAAVFKPGMWNIILILGFVDWPGIARLVRGNVLSLRETNFVKGNIVAGMPLRHILFSEILPNTVAPILVYATSVLALSILDEAALSFLGQGVQPPTSSLGNMLNGAQSLTVLTTQPWLWIPPGLLIVVVVMAINFIGDALRDALDPNSGR
jgi:peptide/nickel transport system permease protein